MTEDRYRNFLGVLFKKTVDGSVKWNETSDDAAFRISFPSGSVLIQRIAQGFDDDIFVATLEDSRGREIASVNDWLPTSSDDEPIEKLFIHARASALDIDGTLDSMEKELEAGEFTAPALPVDDDIPF